MVVPKRARKGKAEQIIDGVVPVALLAGSIAANADDLIVGLASGKEFQVETYAGLSAITVESDGEVLIPKLKVDYASVAGTIAGLTAEFGNPASIGDGAIFFIKDTNDSNKYKIVAVQNGAFLLGAAFTAAA